jgi:hypothetical protein
MTEPTTPTPKPSENTFLGIYIPNQIKLKLKELAKARRQSMSGLTVLILEQYLYLHE